MTGMREPEQIYSFAFVSTILHGDELNFNPHTLSMMVTMWLNILPTFRRKVGFGFGRGSTVEVGSKFSGRFQVKGLQKNYFYGFKYIYTNTFFCASRPGESD